MTSFNEDERHTRRMARLKAARDRIQARKTKEKGLLVVNTGDGKGKSTAAFGMMVRALGWGMRVAIVQFVKGDWETGERNFLEARPGLVTYAVMGEGFTWETQSRARDAAAARAAWDRARELIADDVHDLVILDELNIVLAHGSLPLADVIEGLSARPVTKHVVVTGRGAPAALIELADLVTEFREVKHPYNAGFMAQRGIEF